MHISHNDQSWHSYALPKGDTKYIYIYIYKSRGTHLECC